VAVVVIGRRGAGQLSLGSDALVAHHEVAGRLVGEVPAGEEPLVHARVECHAGTRCGGDCLMCGQLAAWWRVADGLRVECRFSDGDPITRVMTPIAHVPTIGRDRLLAEAAALMATRDVDHLLVTDGRALTGVLAAADLIGPGDALVAARMSRDAVAIDATATLGEAVAVLRALGIGCLPVVSERVVAGWVTRAELQRIGVEL
jgi:CBS domain-containing protein